jgi:hypothetical protein
MNGNRGIFRYIKMNMEMYYIPVMYINTEIDMVMDLGLYTSVADPDLLGFSGSGSVPECSRIWIRIVL